jgi:hypothetical protein
MDIQIAYFRGRTIIATLTDKGWTARDATTGFTVPLRYIGAFAAIEEAKVWIREQIDGWC